MPTISLTTTHEVPAPTREQCEAYMLEQGCRVTNPTSQLTREWMLPNGRYLVTLYGITKRYRRDFLALAEHAIERLAEYEHRSQMDVYTDMISMEVGT